MAEAAFFRRRQLLSFPQAARRLSGRPRRGHGTDVAPDRIWYYILSCKIDGAPMNIALPRAADGLPRRAFTVEDIRRMVEAGVLGEDERFELVEGDLVMMSAKGYAHELIKSALSIALARSLPDGMTMGVEMTLQFDDNTILEPDLVAFRRSSLIKSGANFSHVSSGELSLAIEVAASSLTYDRGLKARLYARHRVQEFWVVDANERITWMHTGPTGDGWSSIVKRGPDEMLTTPALPNFSIKLSEID
jgi:Uma2 family endonuclease